MSHQVRLEVNYARLMLACNLPEQALEHLRNAAKGINVKTDPQVWSYVMKALKYTRKAIANAR